MEIQKEPSALVRPETQSHNSSLPDPDPFVAKKGPVSLKKDDDAASDNANDEDETDVADVGSNHLDELQEKLEKGNLDAAITGSNSSNSNLSDDAKAHKLTNLVQSTIKRGISEINIVSAEENRPTKISAEDGEVRWIKLMPEENSRIVWINGEPILVLNKALSPEGAKIEAESYFLNEVDRIANWYGLSNTYKALFSYLNEVGLNNLYDHFGFVQIPHWKFNEFEELLLSRINEEVKQENFLKLIRTRRNTD